MSSPNTTPTYFTDFNFDTDSTDSVALLLPSWLPVGHGDGLAFFCAFIAPSVNFSLPAMEDADHATLYFFTLSRIHH